MISAHRFYSAYGLSISSDRSIHGLIPLEVPHCDSPDLRILFVQYQRELPNTDMEVWYTTDIKDENGNPGLKIWKDKSTGDFSIRYSSGLAFAVDSKLASLAVYGADSMSDADLSSFLLGPVLGIVLRLKGLTCLHASAVAFRERAIVFAGEEGSGKSTTAAIFARHGHAVLTDDIVALEVKDGAFIVRPGYPILNLLSDSVKLLLGSSESLPKPDPAVEKQQMMLGETMPAFSSEPLPLGAVFILEHDSVESTRTRVEVLSQKNALIELASCTYANKMLDPDMRAAEFRTLGMLVFSAPVLRVIGLTGTPDVQSLYALISDAALASMKLPAHEKTA